MEWGLFLLPVETDVWRTGSLVQWCLRFMGKHWQWRLVGHWQHWGRGIKLVKKKKQVKLISLLLPPLHLCLSICLTYILLYSLCHVKLLWPPSLSRCSSLHLYLIFFLLSSPWVPSGHSWPFCIHYQEGTFFYFIETHLPFYFWRIAWLSLWGQSCCHWNWCGLSHRWWELQCPNLFSWC